MSETPSVATEVASITASVTIDGTPPQTPRKQHLRWYYWDGDAGLLYFQPNPEEPRKPKEVASFEVMLLEELYLDKGEGSESEIAWAVRFKQDKKVIEFTLSESDRATGFMFEKAVNKVCPADFIVYPRMFEHLRTALQETATHVVRRRVTSAMGWTEHNGKRIYLLPGLAGGIGAQGLDPAVKLDNTLQPDEEANDPALARYGMGVRLPDSKQEERQAWIAFKHLVECGTTEVTFPIILQILAGPLYPCGVEEVPPLVHVIGRTGSLKTSFTKAALSTIGTFLENAGPPASWTSTAVALKQLTHYARHVTLLIDDYKASNVDKAVIGRLIQPYADKSARRRSSASQKLQKADVPRGLILSNGEDVWETQASLLARTVLVHMAPDDIDNLRLAQVQKDVREGQLQPFGALWIRWIAQHEKLFSRSIIESLRSGWNEKLQKLVEDVPTVHRRLLDSFASLCAVAEILVKFVGDVWGAQERARAKAWFKALVRWFKDMLTQQADEVQALGALKQLVQVIVEAMSAGEAYLRPHNRIDEEHKNIPDIVTQRATVVGWHDRKEILLSNDRTFGWYKERIRRQGETLSFSWHAICQEAKQVGGSVSQQRYVAADANGTRVQIRALALPMLLFFQLASDGDLKDVAADLFEKV